MVFRQQYKTKQKIKVIDYSKTHSNKETADYFNIHPSMVSRWKSNEERIRNAPSTSIRKGSGRKPFYPTIEKQVYKDAIEQRNNGICLSYTSIAQHMLTRVLQQYPQSQFKATSGWVKGFKKRIKCKLRTPNVLIAASKWKDYSSIDLSKVVDEKIQSFFEYKGKLVQKHKYQPSNIINVDETPVYLNNPSKRTVHFGGPEDAVAIKIMEGNPKARITTILTITSDGKMLNPCIVEASKSKMARTNAGATRYQRQDGTITCWKQENNTVNSSIMVDWINSWLAPQFNHDDRKLLIMDSARGHMTDQVKKVCKLNNIDICMIPGGCTKYLQPLDLTVNRSFKARLKRLYMKSMMGYTGIIDKAKKESAMKINMKILAKDVLTASKQVTKDCILNGWKSAFSIQKKK